MPPSYEAQPLRARDRLISIATMIAGEGSSLQRFRPLAIVQFDPQPGRLRDGRTLSTYPRPPTADLPSLHFRDDPRYRA